MINNGKKRCLDIVCQHSQKNSEIEYALEGFEYLGPLLKYQKMQMGQFDKLLNNRRQYYNNATKGMFDVTSVKGFLLPCA